MSQNQALSNRQIIEKAVIVLLGFLASGLLGFLRIGVVVTQFGAGDVLDAFSIAQQLPETVFVLVAGGALGSSFIPIYARLRESDAKQAWRLASAVMSLSAAAAALFGLLVALFAPQVVELIFFFSPPLEAGQLAALARPEQRQLIVDMVRLMMLTPVIFSVSGLVMGILQSHALFLLPAIAISMNNIGLIFGALVIAPLLPPHPTIGQVGALNVMGLAYGAVLSAVLHLLVQLPGLFQIRARLRILLSPRVPGLFDVLRMMLPRVFGLAVVQVNFYVNIFFTRHMVEGSYSALRYAFMLTFFALGMIGQSVGAAVFPSLAALRAAGDYAGFSDRLARALRNVLFLSFPASALIIVLGEPLVSVLQRGQCTADCTAAVAWALSFYAIGIAGFALLEVLSRAFYALEDTKTPVMAGVGAMLGNIALSALFVRLIGDPASLARGPFAGLALANALTTLVEALVLWWLLRRRLYNLSGQRGLHDRAILRSAGGSLLLSLLMALALWLLARSLPLSGLPLALLGGLLGALLFFGGGYVFGLSEARALLEPLLRRLKR